jgi:hypothetical protein
VPWTEYARDVAGYAVQVGLPVEGRAFVAHLKDYLARIAAEADASFPANEYLRIEAGEPVLARLPRLEEPQDVKELEQRIAERIEPLDILDVLVDTENWLNGKYTLNLDRDSPTLDYTLDLRPGMESTLATTSM